MIKKESYSIEWLDAKVKEHDAASSDLAEKMMHALMLLEQLKLKGLDFIFKGGTALVLMTEEFHRFSKDIDIVIHEEPNNLKEVFDAIVSDTDFIRWEESERQNDEFQVPKKHFKFYYPENKPTKYEKPILLDIIFVESTYPATRSTQIKHPLLVTEEPYTEVIIPTFDSIAGDKLTAFAPNTVGIPIGKNKEIEIAKQLFDLNLLFDKIESHAHVGEAFDRTAQMCVKAYKRDFTTMEVYEDIIETSFTICMMGKHNVPVYNEIKVGVSGLSQYLSKKTKFGYNIAILASSRITYLVACLMKGVEPKKLDWQKVSSDDLKNKRIEHEKYSLLNKSLKSGYPEAWYYWVNTVEILALPNKGKSNNEKKIATVVIAEEIKESPKKNKEEKSNHIHLLFIVNGKETLVDNLSFNQLLQEAVEKALAQTGNSGRPVTDWLVKWDNKDLNILAKIGEFKFPHDVKIFISLKSGVGGSK